MVSVVMVMGDSGCRDGVEVTVMMLVGGGCDSVVLWKREMVVVNGGDIGGGQLGSGDRITQLGPQCTCSLVGKEV